MLKYLPQSLTAVIDIGCGDGTFARSVKDITRAEVWGIEYKDEEAQKAANILDTVFSGPCENFIDDLPENYFDVIYFNDVLEHLLDPYSLLNKVKSKLKPNGVVISSIPNIRYHSALMKLIFAKDWKYQRAGVMDQTHLRFFTKKSIRRMYEEAGFVIEVHEGINKSKSIRPYLFNVLFLFTHMDIRYPQFATVAHPEINTV